MFALLHKTDRNKSVCKFDTTTRTDRLIQNKMVQIKLFVLLFFVITVQELVKGQNCSAVLPPLPDDVATAKAEIISLARNNVNRWGDAKIQGLLNEQATILENWFINNRPDNELELTTGPWYDAWIEDTSIFPSSRFFKLDRNNTYQVVRDGFYYNVAKFDVGPSRQGRQKRSITNYLKGEFTIKNPKSIDSCGKKRYNIIDLKFTQSTIKRGFVPNNIPLTEYVDAYDNGTIRRGLIRINTRTFATGDLWNLFVDTDLRVCYGVDDGSPIDSGGMFILVRQEFVNE